MQETWAIQGVYPSYAWLPDGKSLVVWGQGKLWRVDPFAHTAAEIPFHVQDTREVREAIRFPVDVAPAEFDVKQLRWPNVAPAGDRVAYSALGHLWVKDLPNGTPHRLTDAADRFEYYPHFSRDGREVVFVTWNDAAQGRVVKRDLATGRETVLTPTPGQYIEPAFSPDGRTVVYVKSKGGYLTTPWNGMDTGVYRVAANGHGTPERLSKDGRAPQFGARSDAVYLTRHKTEKEVELSSDLVRIDLADRFHEQTVAHSEFATEYAVSPDGHWLGFVERFHAFVTPLPLADKPLQIATKTDTLPLKQLDAVAGRWLHWSGDSQALHFSMGDTLYTAALKDAFDFVPGAAPHSPKAGDTARALKIGFRQKADVPSGTTAISGARIVTMKGDEVIDDGTIVVQGNRIAAIGPSAQVTVPAGAFHIDAHGKTIIPGLVDVHWHGAMGSDGLIPQQSWIDYASLAFGVTTLHDPSNDSATIFSHAEMQRAGLVVAPRIFSTGTVLYGAKWDQAAVIDSLDDALAHLKRQKAAGAISVKSYNQPRRDQRQQVLEAARETGLMVVPEGASLFELNMTMVVDGHTGVEHALPVGAIYDDVKQLWSQTEVGYTPTLNVAYGGLWGERYWYAHTEVWKDPILSQFVPPTLLRAKAVRREIAPDEDYNVFKAAHGAMELARAGVRVNMGAHGQREGLGAHWDMWSEVKGGMTPMEALRTATLNGAHYLGLDHDIGSLEPGKLADLVILDGNPLADIRQSDSVHAVMLNGRLYTLPRLDEAGAHPKPRQAFFFDGLENVAMPIDAHLHADDVGDGDAQE
jgi:imidazolonepropionase-like amidohydrolase